MLGFAFERCGDREDFSFWKIREGHDIRYLWFSFGNRSSFIENNDFYVTRRFEGNSPLDQNTILSSFARTHHNRGWGRESERTGASNYDDSGKIEECRRE